MGKKRRFPSPEEGTLPALRVLPGPRLRVQHPEQRKMPESEKEEYQTLGASQQHTDKCAGDSYFHSTEATTQNTGNDLLQLLDGARLEEIHLTPQPKLVFANGIKCHLAQLCIVTGVILLLLGEKTITE